MKPAVILPSGRRSVKRKNFSFSLYAVCLATSALNRSLETSRTFFLSLLSSLSAKAKTSCGDWNSQSSKSPSCSQAKRERSRIELPFLCAATTEKVWRIANRTKTLNTDASQAVLSQTSEVPLCQACRLPRLQDKKVELVGTKATTRVKKAI